MSNYSQVLQVLDETLNLQGRTRAYGPKTPLLGALPELDSMAVLALIGGLEQHFGIAFMDEDLQSSAFTNVESLCALVDGTLARQA